MLFNKKKLSIHKIAFLSATIRLDNKGFTVLEMIVVAGIMAVLLTITVANFRGFETNQTLATETEKIVSILRQAQIWALTGQTSGTSRYSFGVHFEECTSGSCSYLLFRDLNSDNFYGSGEELTGAEYNLIKGVYVESLSPQTAGELDIVFEPPFGNIEFNDLEIPPAQAVIVLDSSLTTDTKTVTVNRESGQINIE